MTVIFTSRSTLAQAVGGQLLYRGPGSMPGQSSENLVKKLKMEQYIFANSGFRPSVSFRQYTVIHTNLKATLIRRTSGRRPGIFIKSSAFSYRGEFDRKTHSCCSCSITLISIVMLLLSYGKDSNILMEIGSIGKKSNFILFSSVLKGWRSLISSWVRSEIFTRSESRWTSNWRAQKYMWPISDILSTVASRIE